ncbi:MAG TPA: glycosyltransferase [Pyrinomonadaceae bacterium]|jgi:predicted O-methyltransferase YrrM
MTAQDLKQPLVSCIMPTHNRRGFVAQSLEYFLRQDYEAKELIIVDDGTDAIEDLIPAHERIRYLRLNERLTVGAKRNLACEQARGSLIAHWDDDDWQASHRLRYQVEALLGAGADVCGINSLFFYDVRHGRAWQYVYPANKKLWLSGSSLCYTRSFWSINRFAEINVGEDARFVWNGRPERMTVLPDSSFHVGIIHQHNVSPKQTGGSYWKPIPAEQVQSLIGPDLAFYHPEHARAVESAPRLEVHSAAAAIEVSQPLRNVYACLVHESQECIVDLVRNLRYHDPASTILLYNGGNNPALLNHHFPFEKYGAVLHPAPRPMRWGWLHDFALDCMQFALDNICFDTLTIVDSDQLGVRGGYSSYLARQLTDRANVGLLGNSPARQPQSTRIAPAAQAWREFELWRPFLQRFQDGESKYVHWTFWPSTVFSASAARELVRLFAADAQLREIMERSKIWATEEIILPTLVSLLGYEVAANPCAYDYVKYRTRYSVGQLETALARPDIFWVHPIARNYGDPLRKHLRARFNHYQQSLGSQAEAPPENCEELLLTHPILAEMKKIEGWLEDVEADLLIAVAARALKAFPQPQTIVEVGSYMGRATVVLGRVARVLSQAARIYSIDRHDGKIGALDQGLETRAPTLDRFRRNLAAAGLAEMVEVIQKSSYEVDWDQDIHLLLIDGLHDYANVARDFFHFERWVLPGGFVAFHDYASYYPGVQSFVNEILSAGQYRQVRLAGSMMVLQKLPAAPALPEEA